MREARFGRNPATPHIHLENLFYGLTQLSKTPEIAFACWCSYFILGCVPIVFVRNKGGRIVGSEDIRSSIEDGPTSINGMVQTHLKAIKQEGMFSFLTEAMFRTFTLKCRLTSDKKYLEYDADGINTPQVLVCCMNMRQNKNLFDPPKSSDQAMGVMQLLTGGEGSCYTGKCDYPDLPADSKKNPIRTRVTLICDEDDLTRSTYKGTNHVEKMNWNMLLEYRKRIEQDLQAQHRGITTHDSDCTDDDDDGIACQGGASGDTNEPEVDRDFIKQVSGLRSQAYGCISVTATPIALFYHLCEKDIHIVVLKPPPNYIGYPMLEQKYDYLTKFIAVKRMNERPNNRRVAKTGLYQYQYWLSNSDRAQSGEWDMMTNSFTGKGGVPDDAFHMNSKGYISCKRGMKAEYPEVSSDWEKVNCLFKQVNTKINHFWKIDGPNMSKMIEDMLGGCEPDRRGLVITNFTRTDQMKEAMAKKLLREFGARGLIVLIYSHKHVKMLWSDAAHNQSTIITALTGTGTNNANDEKLWRGSGVHTPIERTDNTVTFTSKFNNINHLYSALERYKVAIMKKSTMGAPSRLVTVCLTGDIGGRGVRYKPSDHAGILTDLFLAFDISPTRQVTVHGETLTQNLGRLATIVRDIITVKSPTLWIPKNCYEYFQVELSLIDQMVSTLVHHQTAAFTSGSAPSAHTFAERLKHVLNSATQQRDDAITTHFAAAIGSSSKGKALHARATRPSMDNGFSTSVREAARAKRPSLKFGRMHFRSEEEVIQSVIAHFSAQDDGSESETDMPEVSIPERLRRSRKEWDCRTKTFTRARVEKVLGMTRSKALMTQYVNEDGDTVPYLRCDLEYDLQQGYLEYYQPGATGDAAVSGGGSCGGSSMDVDSASRTAAGGAGVGTGNVSHSRDKLTQALLDHAHARQAEDEKLTFNEYYDMLPREMTGITCEMVEQKLEELVTEGLLEKVDGWSEVSAPVKKRARIGTDDPRTLNRGGRPEAVAMPSPYSTSNEEHFIYRLANRR
jgi:hypothetical protein